MDIVKQNNVLTNVVKELEKISSFGRGDAQWHSGRGGK